MELIKAEGIEKEYEHFKIQNFSLTLSEGKLFGILGPNGSGKSTIIKIFTGQILPSKGNIDVLGTNPIRDPIKTKEKIGIIPEQESPPSFLTVTEYLEFIAKVRKLSHAKTKIHHWLDFLELKTEKDSIIKNLSRGTKQKVLFAQAFIHEPKLVFIDEPLVNLDPLVQKKMKSFLQEYVAKGNTILLSTHILSTAEEICDEICILKNGKILFRGSISESKKEKKNLEDFFVELIENEN